MGQPRQSRESVDVIDDVDGGAGHVELPGASRRKSKGVSAAADERAKDAESKCLAVDDGDLARSPFAPAPVSPPPFPWVGLFGPVALQGDVLFSILCWMCFVDDCLCQKVNAEPTSGFSWV